MAFVATDQIIKELCLELDDPGFLRYNKLLGGVLDGIRDLSIYNLPTYSYATLNLNAYNAVVWTCSCVKPLLTYLLRNGNMVLLDVDEGIRNTFPVSAEDQAVAVADCSCGDLFLTDGFAWSGQFNWGLGELYGLSGKSCQGFVTHNKNNRQSFVTGRGLETTDQIVMYFKSDGLSECPKEVWAECKTAIEHYALYKYWRNRDPKLSELNLKNYKENFTRITKFENDEGLTPWSDAIYSNVRSSPKGF